MKIKGFKGGIHPSYHKELTKGCETIKLEPGKLVYIPLLQHIGAPCSSLVSVGDSVLTGQKIGESDAFVSSPVHSSVSGTVKEIKKYLHPNGTMVETIVIENDFKYKTIPETKKNFRKLSPEEILKTIREAGIVGMGGAGFPAHIKFTVSEKKPIEYVIINGAECEPYLSSDHRAMLEQPKDLVRGLEIIMKTVRAKHGIIAIENNKPDAIDAVKTHLGKKAIDVAVLKTKYPQGSEKHIIKALLGRTIPSGKLPADVGVVVANVDTAISVKNALATGMPVVRRRVTVSGLGIENPAVFSVAIGTPVQEIIDAAGGFKESVSKVVLGGPMMGTQIFDTDVPAVKTTSGLLALTDKETEIYEESPCTRCGKCVSVCPMGLLPLNISSAGRNENAEKALSNHVTNCIECGCCSYICPSRRNLVEGIRLAKTIVQPLLAGKK